MDFNSDVKPNVDRSVHPATSHVKAGVSMENAPKYVDFPVIPAKNPVPMAVPMVNAPENAANLAISSHAWRPASRPVLVAITVLDSAESLVHPCASFVTKMNCSRMTCSEKRI